MMRPRIQSYDSTFGRDATQSYTLHLDGVPTTIPSLPAVSVFDDSNSYWTANDGHDHSSTRYQPGWSSVNVPDTGTTIRVKSISHTGFAQIDVNK
jgi:immune inhibitor A